MLGKASGNGVAVGVSPRAEAACTALFDDRGLNLLEDLVEVAGFLGQVQTQRAGVAHERRGQVSFDEVAAVLEKLLQQRLGMCIVGAEVSSLFAVLLDPLGNLLKDVSLCAGNANVGGGVGSGLKDELHAELFAGSLHDGNTAAHGLISHVAREGDMNKGVAAELVRGADDQVAAGNEVVVADEVSSGADLGQVFVGLTGDADDVGAAFLDLTEGLGRAGNALVDDDCLHVGIVREVDDGLNGGLQLFGEVVGIDGQLDHVLAVHCLESLRAAAVVLRLGDGTGNDADVDVAGFFGRGSLLRGSGFLGLGFFGLGFLGRGALGLLRCRSGVAGASDKAQQHHKSEQQAYYFFHTNLQF